VEHARDLVRVQQIRSYLRLIDFVSLNSRLESNKEEEKIRPCHARPRVQSAEVRVGVGVEGPGLESHVLGCRVEGLEFRVG